MNSPTNRSVGPNENRIVSSSERLSGGSALIVTLSCSSSSDSSRSLAKVGISVSNCLASSSSYLTVSPNSPCTVSPRDEISSTFPCRTSSRKVGLYGTWMRSSAGAKIATISQFSRNRTARIARKRRPLQGSIGGFCGARSTRTSPRLGSRGGSGVRGSGERVSLAMIQS